MWTLRALSLMMLFVIGAAAVKVVGPMVEMQFIQPVRALSFDTFDCREKDVIARGTLDKTFWPDGREAKFLGLSLYRVDTEPRERLSWRRPDPADKSPESRPGGRQLIEVYIDDACGVPFTAHTRHESPWTGFVLPMKFGPYQVSGDAVRLDQ